jgi:hypothetical protein
MPPLKYQTPSSYVGKKAAPKPPVKPAAPARPVVAAPKIPARKVTSRYTGPPVAGSPAASALGLAVPAGPTGAGEVTGTAYEGADTSDFGGSYGPQYTGPSSSLLAAQMGEDLGAMASGMTSKIRQALVDLGLTDRSQLTGGAAQYVDEPTWQAAANNKYSLFATLKASADKQTAQSRAKLAAAGMLGSGQLTNEANSILKQLEEKSYAGVRTFSGTVGELLAAYAQRQRDWASRLAEARFAQQQVAAAGGQVDLGAGLVGRAGEWADLPVSIGYDPVRNADAQYDLSGATQIGPDRYRGPQGQIYDSHGRVAPG